MKLACSPNQWREQSQCQRATMSLGIFSAGIVCLGLSKIFPEHTMAENLWTRKVRKQDPSEMLLPGQLQLDQQIYLVA